MFTPSPPSPYLVDIALDVMARGGADENKGAVFVEHTFGIGFLTCAFPPDGGLWMC